MVISNIKKKSPKKFTALSSIIFKYYYHSMTGLGVMKIDRNKNCFHTALITPSGGMKIFEIKYENGKFEPLYVMDEFIKYDNFATAVGGDIKNIYMEFIPEKYYSVKIKDDRIIFKSKKGSKDIEYTVAGKDMMVLQKIIRENNDIETIISYYEYKNLNGVSYPRGIVLENKKYGYTLIAELKELNYD